uniref:C-type LECtin n=1 Tax=Caenorhabditis tropicalis TaxID=1561998 RepID=A0A1I7UGK9_9PELO
MSENSDRKFPTVIHEAQTLQDNRAVSNFAASAGLSTLWIGVFCFSTANTTTCYHDDNTGTLTYNSFASGNPKIQGAGGCVYMSTATKTAGQWYSQACEVTNMAYVCEVPATVAGKTTCKTTYKTHSDSTCTHNYNGYCYLPSHEMKLSTNLSNYASAQAFCQASGANLASIHSKPEIDFIRAIYRNTGIQQIFLGAQGSKWVDGSKWDYDYTDPLATVKDSCLAMEFYPYTPNNGMWTQTNCGNAFSFLCKKKIGSKTSQEQEPIHEILDASNCNTTLFMAPGVITSFGYPTKKPAATFCTWKLVTLGPYRVGVYFTDFSTADPVYIYDENGFQINGPSGNQSPFYTLAYSNIVTITHDSKNDAKNGFHGFSATVLPH